MIKDSQFWWILVSSILVVIGSILPRACEQLLGNVDDSCKYGAVACLAVGFIGLIISMCSGCGTGGWTAGIIGGIMLMGACITCVLACNKTGDMPSWCKYLIIPALIGLILLGIVAGGWYAVFAVLFLVLGCAMMVYQRRNSVVDGLGGPMIGMGWLLLAMASASE